MKSEKAARGAGSWDAGFSKMAFLPRSRGHFRGLKEIITIGTGPAELFSTGLIYEVPGAVPSTTCQS